MLSKAERKGTEKGDKQASMEAAGIEACFISPSAVPVVAAAPTTPSSLLKRGSYAAAVMRSPSGDSLTDASAAPGKGVALNYHIAADNSGDHTVKAPANKLVAKYLAKHSKEIAEMKDEIRTKVAAFAEQSKELQKSVDSIKKEVAMIKKQTDKLERGGRMFRAVVHARKVHKRTPRFVPIVLSDTNGDRIWSVLQDEISAEERNLGNEKFLAKLSATMNSLGDELACQR